MVRSIGKVSVVLVALLGAMMTCAVIAADDDKDSKWIEVGGGDWHPAAQDLSALEQALKSALPAAAKHHGRPSSWEKYWFQYQGQKSVSGSQVIHVNAFCDAQSHYTNMHNRWLYVSGGGACYFQADYDPASSQLSNMQVNSES